MFIFRRIGVFCPVHSHLSNPTPPAPASGRDHLAWWLVDQQDPPWVLPVPAPPTAAPGLLIPQPWVSYAFLVRFCFCQLCHDQENI